MVTITRNLTETEEQLGFRRLDPPETTRVYVWAGGDRLEYHEVWAVAVRPSGNHRLMCAEGNIIVNGGWLAVEFDAGTPWSF